jgi:hypothetical protein
LAKVNAGTLMSEGVYCEQNLQLLNGDLPMQF